MTIPNITPLDKRQRGMYLRRLFEERRLGVIGNSSLYFYLDKCGLRKELYGHMCNNIPVFYFFPETCQGGPDARISSCLQEPERYSVP